MSNKKVPNNLILIGFGKYEMKDLVSWIEDPEKTDKLEQHLRYQIETPWKLMPHYREMSSCSQEEILNYKKYAEWLIKLVGEIEEKK